jgi:hypothetical protein
MITYFVDKVRSARSWQLRVSRWQWNGVCALVPFFAGALTVWAAEAGKSDVDRGLTSDR